MRPGPKAGSNEDVRVLGERVVVGFNEARPEGRE